MAALAVTSAGALPGCMPLLAIVVGPARARSTGAPPFLAVDTCLRRLHPAVAASRPSARRSARAAGGRGRYERQIRIREQAERAGPKIQLVVAFVLVPSVMLVIAAALIAELTAPGVGHVLTPSPSAGQG